MRGDHAPESVLADVTKLAETLGDAHLAAVVLRRRAAARPDNARLWLKLGAAECDMNHLDQGIAATREAVEVDPTLVPAWHNLTLALGRQGDIAASKKALRQGLALAPKNPALRRLSWRIRLRHLVRL
jgi:tetratricopeptide (TPR) repeat protein